MMYTNNTMTKEQALATASVMELIEALEKALPQGEMVVIGNGEAFTDAHKKWLIQLAGGCNCNCDCKCYEVDEDENYKRGFEEGRDEGYAEGYLEGKEKGYNEGHEDGYDEGYADAEACCGDDYEEYYDAMQRIIAIIDDIETID